MEALCSDVLARQEATDARSYDAHFPLPPPLHCNPLTLPYLTYTEWMDRDTDFFFLPFII